jgi:hypothetical protein
LEVLDLEACCSQPLFGVSSALDGNNFYSQNYEAYDGAKMKIQLLPSRIERQNFVYDRDSLPGSRNAKLSE